MSFSEIVGTRLSVRVAVAPQECVDLASPEGRGVLAAMALPAELMEELEQGTRVPFDEAFHRAWGEQRDATVARVVRTIREVTPGAYDFVVAVPERGALFAEVGGKRLDLDYRVNGFRGRCAVRNSVFGKRADPVVHFSFDARLVIGVAVPDDARVPLRLQLAFHTENTKGSLGPGLGNLMSGALAVLRRTLVAQPASRRLELEDCDAPELVRQFGHLSRGFAAAAAAGYAGLEPAVFDEGDGVAVGFRLGRR
jgi:hypothetical protein